MKLAHLVAILFPVYRDNFVLLFFDSFFIAGAVKCSTGIAVAASKLLSCPSRILSSNFNGRKLSTSYIAETSDSPSKSFLKRKTFRSRSFKKKDVQQNDNVEKSPAYSGDHITSPEILSSIRDAKFLLKGSSEITKRISSYNFQNKSEDYGDSEEISSGKKSCNGAPSESSASNQMENESIPQRRLRRRNSKLNVNNHKIDNNVDISYCRDTIIYNQKRVSSAPPISGSSVYGRRIPCSAAQMSEQLKECIYMPSNSKVMKAAVLGLPNSGKSTLINALMDMKVFILFLTTYFICIFMIIS